MSKAQGSSFEVQRSRFNRNTHRMLVPLKEVHSCGENCLRHWRPLSCITPCPFRHQRIRQVGQQLLLGAIGQTTCNGRRGRGYHLGNYSIALSCRAVVGDGRQMNHKSQGQLAIPCVCPMSSRLLPKHFVFVMSKTWETSAR